MARQQLPPQIKKIEVTDRKTGKTVVKYQLRVDGCENSSTGKRQQVKRRFDTEKAARAALAEIADQASKGTFVARDALTVDEMCRDYLIGRHNLRDTSSSKIAYDLGPLRERHGDLPVQRLTKARLDVLVADLAAGGTKTAKGRTRRPWSASSVNKAIDTWAMVLADAHQQGLVTRNVGERIAHVAARHNPAATYTEAEVHTLLAAITDNRLGHAWELALSGLRRGEIAGLRWSDIDLEAKTLSVANNRVDAGGRGGGERPEVGVVAPDPAAARPTGGGAAVGEGPAGARAAGARCRQRPVGVRRSRTKPGAHTTLRCCLDTGRRPSRRRVYDTSSSTRPDTPARP